MKYVPWLLGGLVLGFLLGGIGPRRELADADTELSALRDALIKAEHKVAKRRFFGSPVPQLDQAFEQAEEQAEVEADHAERRQQRNDGVHITLDTGKAGGHPDDGPKADPMEQFDAAVDAQRLRASQSRQALREQAGIDEATDARLDAVIATMNEDLSAYADDLLWLAEDAQAGEEPDAREMLSLSHDVTGVLLDAQVALESAVGEEGLSNVEDATSVQVWNYIDLESFRSAAEKSSATQVEQ